MYTRPLWDPQSRLVYGESGLFKGSEGVKLLFPAEEILHLYNPSLEKEYLPGVHFNHTPGSDLITPVPGSGICGLGPEGIFPAPETAILFPKPGANAIGGGPDGKLVIFNNAHFFAYHQFNVDYRAVPGTVFPEIPAPAVPLLPRCRAAFKEKRTINAILIGDSISEGLNASGYHNFAPFSPPYINWFVFGLQKKYGVKVEICNHGVNGSGCDSAFDLQDLWTADAPDLMIIAYGMNDFSRMNADEFVNILSKIRRIMKEKNPQTEFLFIASMSGNPDWERTKPGRDAEFAARLIKFVSEYPDCAVCDMYRAYGELQRRKGFFAVSGNGVNHPNDFGHRFYASILLETVEKMF